MENFLPWHGISLKVPVGCYDVRLRLKGAVNHQVEVFHEQRFTLAGRQQSLHPR